VSMLTLAHSISADRSRMTALSVRMRSRDAASATMGALCAMICGAAPPTARGQK